MNKLITFFFISLFFICQSLYGDVVLGKLSDASWVSAGGNDMVLSFGRPALGTNFQVEIKTTVTNQLFTITPTDAVDLYIDWGDGNISNYTGSARVDHYYVNAITTTVALSGTTTKILFGYDTATRNVLTRILSPILGMDLTSGNMLFYLCYNLENIYAGMFNYATNVTDFESLFRMGNTTYAGKLTEVPEGLFTNCLKCTKFKQIFRSTKIKYIPDIFGNNTNATDFSYMCNYAYAITNVSPTLFSGCTKVTTFQHLFYRSRVLSEIPSGFFDSNTIVNNFSYAFAGCWGLTTIPSGLFDNNTEVTTFGNTFNNAVNIIDIPSGLFTNCQKVTTYKSTFNGCTALKDIPAVLFGTNNNAIDFTQTFYINTSLTNVPSTLFDGCTNMSKTIGLFQGCAAIVSDVPELWDTAKFGNATLAVEANHLNTFTGCINAGNYADIPDAWKGL